MSTRVEWLIGVKDLILQENDGVNFFARLNIDDVDEYLIHIDVYEGTIYDESYNMEEYELFMKAEYYVIRKELKIKESDLTIDSENASEMLFNLYKIMTGINEY